MGTGILDTVTRFFRLSVDNQGNAFPHYTRVA